MQIILNDTFTIDCKSIEWGTKDNNLQSLAIFVNEFNQEVFDFLSSNSIIKIVIGDKIINNLNITNYIYFNEDQKFYSLEGRQK